MCCVHFVVSAGIDTSRITLYFIIRYMAGLQDIQKKVHEELDKVVGKPLKAVQNNIQALQSSRDRKSVV